MNKHIVKHILAPDAPEEGAGGASTPAGTRTLVKHEGCLGTSPNRLDLVGAMLRAAPSPVLCAEW